MNQKPTTVTLATATLLEGLAFIKNFRAKEKENLRPILHAVQLEFKKEGQAELTATDCYIAGFFKFNLKQPIQWNSKIGTIPIVMDYQQLSEFQNFATKSHTLNFTFPNPKTNEVIIQSNRGTTYTFENEKRLFPSVNGIRTRKLSPLFKTSRNRFEDFFNSKKPYKKINLKEIEKEIKASDFIRKIKNLPKEEQTKEIERESLRQYRLELKETKLDRRIAFIPISKDKVKTCLTNSECSECYESFEMPLSQEWPQDLRIFNLNTFQKALKNAGSTKSYDNLIFNLDPKQLFDGILAIDIKDSMQKKESLVMSIDIRHCRKNLLKNIANWEKEHPLEEVTSVAR